MGPKVEVVNSERVTRSTTRMDTAPIHADYATPEYLQEKNVDGRAWIVRTILGHIVATDGQLEFQIYWYFPYAEAWEPR